MPIDERAQGETRVPTGRPDGGPSEELLVLRAQLGDRRSLGALVERLHPEINRFLRNLAADDDVGDDLTQETWLRALRSLARLEQPVRFRPWLFTIARRTATDRLRRRYRRRATIDDRVEPDLGELVADPTRPDPLTRRLAQLDLVAGAGGLDLELREVLALHYLADFSVDDVAGIVGVPPGTVKSRLHRARRQLAPLLDVPSAVRSPAPHPRSATDTAIDAATDTTTDTTTDPATETEIEP
ncbi:MAG: RNA polymerase sigma factor [Actinomycetota bacterium]